MHVGIVVPVFNEEGNVAELSCQLLRALEPFGVTFGFLLVDDGSRDRTVAVLDELHAADPRVRHLSVTRNFGHQAALLAGLEHSSGDCVITTDADLQHPPDVVPALVRHWANGADVVVTSRGLGTSMGAAKRAATRGFYRLMSRLSGLQLPVGTAGFRLLDKHVVDTIVACPERQKFLRGLAAWTGFQTATVEYRVGARYARDLHQDGRHCG